MQWAKFKILWNHLREHFSRSWMPLRKTNFTSHKVFPFVLFKILKVWFQPPKPVQPVLKPVQPVSVLFTLPPLLWPIWQSELSEKSQQIFFWNRLSRNFSLLSRFWNRSSLRLSSSVDRDPPGRNRFNRSENRFNRFLLLFSQRLPAFGGSFIYPLTLSLSLIYSCLSHEFLADQPSNKRIHFTFHTRNRISFNHLKDPWCEVNSIEHAVNFISILLFSLFLSSLQT